jgi:hypothetical protein
MYNKIIKINKKMIKSKIYQRIHKKYKKLIKIKKIIEMMMRKSNEILC